MPITIAPESSSARYSTYTFPSRTIAAGLKVCNASQCTGLPRIGSAKTAFAFGSMIGASTGRAKGPSVQLCADCASNELAAQRKPRASKLRSMETTLQNTLRHNVSIHGLHNIRLCCVGPQAQLGIQRIQLVRVVMIGARCARAHAHVAHLLPPVQRLDRSIRQLCLRRHSLWKLARCAWNIKDHPVQ